VLASRRYIVLCALEGDRTAECGLLLHEMICRLNRRQPHPHGLFNAVQNVAPDTVRCRMVTDHLKGGGGAGFRMEAKSKFDPITKRSRALNPYRTPVIAGTFLDISLLLLSSDHVKVLDSLLTSGEVSWDLVVIASLHPQAPHGLGTRLAIRHGFHLPAPPQAHCDSRSVCAHGSFCR
jgi:hypothetical protein